ncbi:MAG: FGGY family carbohydrate kinase [Prolixibacteraceae bacterium]|jgi:sugar (pentulose or hexulose) kinase|nr:FGGY family carbohydrate kinase [Prolixibacteraceae bacterium]
MKGIVVFDIGKTNKKILLFDENLKIVWQKEGEMPPTVDEDGFECDDIEQIEKWMLSSLEDAVKNSGYDVVAVNFSTYGATLVFLDGDGKRLGPLINYLKPVDEGIASGLFEQYGGQDEFCRQTASPSLGLLLNSGIQILWQKDKHPERYRAVESILHFPQYLSYLLTQRVTSEPTSIGCHTFMWDFDNKKYHSWLEDNGIQLPEPENNDKTTDVDFAGKSIKVGVGVHDSSSSLVPYLLGTDEKFILLSTGTWCISMNPFNDELLTADELRQDCLNYLNIYRKPVKSARYFMGHIHDVNVEVLNGYFNAPDNAYKLVKTDEVALKKYLKSGEKVFFKNGTPENYIDISADLSQFDSFEAAYNQFIFDLTVENAKSLKLVVPSNDDVESLIVSGGFARNPIYMKTLVSLFPNKKVYTSEIDNATALGAAMVCSDGIIDAGKSKIDLGLERWLPVE